MAPHVNQHETNTQYFSDNDITVYKISSWFKSGAHKNLLNKV